tara:strand:- start:2833 stop:3276 length:444 start_codon:yes stop_codon:yes gene_type:complete
MSEKTLRKYISQGLKKHGKLSQIESHATSVGFPDTHYCLDGREGVIELKYWSLKKEYAIRKTQIAWLRDYLKANGKRAWLLTLREYMGEKVYMLIHVNDHNLKVMQSTGEHVRWELIARHTWSRNVDFDQLADLLKFNAMNNGDKNV